MIAITKDIQTTHYFLPYIGWDNSLEEYVIHHMMFSGFQNGIINTYDSVDDTLISNWVYSKPYYKSEQDQDEQRLTVMVNQLDLVKGKMTETEREIQLDCVSLDIIGDLVYTPGIVKGKEKRVRFEDNMFGTYSDIVLR